MIAMSPGTGWFANTADGYLPIAFFVVRDEAGGLVSSGYVVDRQNHQFRRAEGLDGFRGYLRVPTSDELKFFLDPPDA